MKEVKIILISSLIFFLSCKNKAVDTNLQKKDSTDSVGIENIKGKTEIKDYTQAQSLKNCNETFEAFFKQFGKDSIFQVNRIKYPLKWKYLNDVTDKELTLELVKYGSFNYIDFTNDEEAHKNEYDKYSVDVNKNKDHILYILNGIDNGIYVMYKFKLIEGCWYMVEILDEST